MARGVQWRYWRRQKVPTTPSEKRPGGTRSENRPPHPVGKPTPKRVNKYIKRRRCDDGGRFWFFSSFGVEQQQAVRFKRVRFTVRAESKSGPAGKSDFL